MAERVSSAEELLRRYAEGERDFEGAQLREAELSGAQLPGVSLRRADLSRAGLRGAALKSANLGGTNLKKADLNWADLREADLREAHVRRVDLHGTNLSKAHLSWADLREANLRYANLAKADLLGANLSKADLRGANFEDTTLTGAELTYCALDHSADLLAANWSTLKIGGSTYHRDAVERGEQVLPIGMGAKLELLIETARLEGRQQAAAAAAVDYVANAAPGVSAEVVHKGGGGTIIRFGVREKEDADVLLQVGDGFCRLIGLGSGVTPRLPGATVTASDLDDRFALQAQRAGYRYDDLKEGLDGIRDALTKVTLSGFNDEQMAALRTVAELGSELLKVKVHEDYVEALRAPSSTAGKIAKAAYDTEVAKPLRVLLEALFQKAYKAQQP